MNCEKCDRPSCLPPDYAPLCSHHYLESIERAKQEAHAWFEARVAELQAAKAQVSGENKPIDAIAQEVL